MAIELPSLKPEQWDLLARLIRAEARLKSKGLDPEPFVLVETNHGSVLSHPQLGLGSQAEIVSAGDITALRKAGALDETGIASFQVSGPGYELHQRRSAPGPTKEEELRTELEKIEAALAHAEARAVTLEGHLPAVASLLTSAAASLVSLLLIILLAVATVLSLSAGSGSAAVVAVLAGVFIALVSFVDVALGVDVPVLRKWLQHRLEPRVEAWLRARVESGHSENGPVPSG